MSNLRRFALTCAFVLAGCGSPNGAARPVSDGGSNLDGHLDTNPGTAGSSCATACDCQPGLACIKGVCASGGMAAYCCSSSSCPSGSTCQQSNGAFSVCGGGSTGGGTPGGGTPGGGGGGLPGLGDLGFPGGGGLPGFGDLGFGGLPGGGSGDGGAASSVCALLTCTQDSDCTGNPLIPCSSCNTSTGTCQ